MIHSKTSQRLIVLVTMQLITSCGFQLRGNFSVPAAMLPLHVVGSGPLAQALKYHLSLNQVQLAGAATARSVLQVEDAGHDRRIQSLDDSARAAEYIIWQRATATLLNNQGEALFPAREFIVRRVITNDPNDPVSESSEIDLIYDEMRQELAEQITRQLEYWGSTGSGAS